jgi:hypothetical protein
MWWEDLMERDHLGELGIDRRKILKWYDSSGSGQGSVAGSYECDNKALGSLTCREFLSQPNYCDLLKNN